MPGCLLSQKQHRTTPCRKGSPGIASDCENEEFWEVTHMKLRMAQCAGFACRRMPATIQCALEENCKTPLVVWRQHNHVKELLWRRLFLLSLSIWETGKSMKIKSRAHVIAFNKPYDVLPCFTDPEGRSTLADYIDLPGVYAAGRLDRDSEGLMILTSDGALLHRITDPKHKLPKVYLAQVERIPTEQALNQLRHGVLLSGKRTRPAAVRLLEEKPLLPDRPVPIRFRKNVPTVWLEITLHEGMNRQIRRMTAAVGHPTLRLVRIAIGPIRLGDLEPGQWKEVKPAQLKSLRSS